jgi:23S rRNA maturation-related 3'-5' exoribonuclease YhaM
MDYSTYRFDKEISIIQNPTIKRLVVECIKHAPDYFWTIPSSSTGKYHPDDENTIGGCVLHTMRCVAVADVLATSYNLPRDEWDCLLAAAIMHDFCKNGYPDDSGHTVSGHGSLFVHVLERVVKRSAIATNPMVSSIAKMIANHMGRFDIPYSIGDDKLSTLLHLADMICSRSNVLVKVN